MLTSANVHLRPVEREDLGLLVKWRNDERNWQAFFNKFPLSLAGQQAWYECLNTDSARKLFMVCLNYDSVPVGTVGLDHIDFPNQCAEYGNLLIGSPEQRGQGLAMEASRLLLDYAFRHLNMNRLYLRVFKDNSHAVRLYERMGFVGEGIAREHIFADGRFRDVLLMGCLRREYAAASEPACDGQGADVRA